MDSALDTPDRFKPSGHSVREVWKNSVPGRMQNELEVPEAITRDNWQDPQMNRWSFRHFSETVPTARVSKTPVDERNQSKGFGCFSEVDDIENRLRDSYTDALLVQRGDEVIGEWYAPGVDVNDTHLLMSVSKSLMSIVVGSLIDDGLVDPKEKIENYVPELAGSGFASATVQEALDMLVAVEFSETYDDPHSEVRAHDRAASFRTPRDGEPQNVYDFLAMIAQSAAHGQKFQYCSAVSDVLGWVIENVTQKRYADALSDRLWSKLGCDYDARVGVDRVGFALANGAVESTARDLARVGRMMLNGGVINGNRIVSESWVRETMRGGLLEHTQSSPKREVFPEFTYKNQWWIVGDARGSVHGVGIHGQYLWLDPQTDTIIVKFSSAPDAVNYDDSRDAVNLFADLIKVVEQRSK